MWPILEVILISNCAVCWNCLWHFDTNNISLFLIIAVLVKIQSSNKWNQPVTNDQLSSKLNLVGTSETTRATSKSKKEKEDLRFNQWLAGLIDGDGSLLISKSGYSSCEITVHLADERILRIIQNKLGGSIKARSGVKAIRWRLYNRLGMLDLINRINGYIRHTNRLIQLNYVCTLLNIELKSPDILNNKHAWFSGFFDACGKVDLKNNKNKPELILIVTNKLYANIVHFVSVFGGEIYFNKGRNGYYIWTLKTNEQLSNFKEYVRNCPLQSVVRNRFFLIKEFNRVISLEAYKAPEGTLIRKSWLMFKNKFNLQRDIHSSSRQVISVNNNKIIIK
jgi:LAGLIDADG endonuclease